MDDSSSPTDASTEGDLLARFRDGDRQAFNDLVSQYQNRLVQFFYRLCWDRGRSEDFTQNLFMKLLRTSVNYRPEGKLATFIFRIATNLWIDHYRSSRPGKQLYSLDQAMMTGHEPRGAVTTETPSDLAEAGEDRARLRASLEQLTEPHRLVFELAVYQQLPYSEISSVLDIPIGTVKSRMHNAVKALRAVLSEPGADEVAPHRSFRPARNGTAG